MKKEVKLTYRLFDFDENILSLDTKLYLEKFENNKWIDVTFNSKEFKNIIIDNITYRCKENFNYAFSEFSDYGIRGNKAFMIDVKNALGNKKFGPAWKLFKETIINGNFFLIVTARRHSKKTLQNAIEYIVDYSLTPYEKELMLLNLANFRKLYKKPEIDKKKLLKKYFNNCRYVGVMSNEFEKTFKNKIQNKKLSTGEKKELVIKDFIKYVHKYTEKLHAKASINFSDDTIETVEYIEKIFKHELSHIYPYDFSISNTSDSSIEGGILIKI